MVRQLGIAFAVLVIVGACGACGGGSGDDGATIDAAIDGPSPCARGDDCDVAANTGCDDDDRCAVVKLNACYFPSCEPFGSTLAGQPCTLSNNEGAEVWDDCGPSMVCYAGVCTQACTLSVSGAGCTAPATCMQDPDVGAFALGVCVAP